MDAAPTAGTLQLPFACGLTVQAATYSGGEGVGYHGSDGNNAVDFYRWDSTTADKIHSSFGTPLFAPAAATVKSVSGENEPDGSSRDTTITLRFQSSGLEMTVRHLRAGGIPQRLKTTKNATVAAGEKFGEVGWNGTVIPKAVTNAHAHTELRDKTGTLIRPPQFGPTPLSITYNSATSAPVGLNESHNCVGAALAAGLRNRIVRDSTSPASYYIDGNGLRHHIPDSPTYWCLVDRGIPVASDLVPGSAITAAFADGGPQERCISVARYEGRILRGTDGRAFVARGGLLRSIVDGYTWDCLRGRGLQLDDNLDPGALSRAPRGADEPACLNPASMVGKIVRDTNGRAVYVADDRLGHWVPDSPTWQCRLNRGTQVVQVTVAHVDSLSMGGWDDCFDRTVFLNTVTRHVDGDAHYVSLWGTATWIPDTATWLCRTRGQGLPVVTTLRRNYIDALEASTKGQWDYCLDVNVLKHSVLRHADGDAHHIDGNGNRFWIPDTATWRCRTWSQGLQVIDTRWREYVNRIPQVRGHEWDYCLDVNLLKGKILRHSDGDAHYVDGNGIRHWIPTGSVYNCLVGRGVEVIDTRWREYVNNIREGSWGTC